MTQDIIEIARQAGFVPEINSDITVKELETFYKLATERAVKAEQEPVAWMDADGNVSDNNDHKCFPIPLYTHPPQEQQSCDKRTWVGLTDGEVDDAARYCVKSGQSVNAAIRAIEAKLKEKNT